ncbi:MAG: hypothetical protein IJ841_09370 [Prevotella sp.]|nr:hypothetical protein [Prevotella sp.]
MAREKGGAKYAYGICTNTDHDGNGNPCPKCASKERIRLSLRDEFVCPECGEQLTKVGGTDPVGPNWKLIGIIAAAVVLIGGGLGWFFGIYQPQQREKAAQEERLAFVADSLRQDSIAKAQKAEADKKAREEALAREEAEAQARINDSIEAANKAKEETKEEPQEPGPKPKNPPYGSYSGPRDGNGNPHGVGGEVRITRSYSLDLKKSPAEYVQLSSGDKIVNTKFVNGQLKQGEIVFTDGRRKWINL